jgi:hypothetical protein
MRDRVFIGSKKAGSSASAEEAGQRTTRVHDMVSHSPRMVAQRRQFASLFASHTQSPALVTQLSSAELPMKESGAAERLGGVMAISMDIVNKAITVAQASGDTSPLKALLQDVQTSTQHRYDHKNGKDDLPHRERFEAERRLEDQLQTAIALIERPVTDQGPAPVFADEEAFPSLKPASSAPATSKSKGRMQRR